MNGKSINGIVLQVSLARKQPCIEPINDASSSAVWSTLATSQSQKGNHKDKRELVVYNVDEMFS
jgi:negative elongation factor E